LLVLTVYEGVAMLLEFRGELRRKVYDPDFLALWSAGRAPLGSIYDTAKLAVIQAPWTHVALPRPFPYPPTLLPFLKPFGALPFPVAMAAWTVLGLAAWLLSFRRQLHRAEILVLMLTTSVLYAAASGQTTLVLGAAIVWAVFELPLRPYAAGAVLGFVAAIKPQLVVLAPLLLLSDRRALMAFVAAASLLVAVSVAFFGLETWRAWIASLDGFNAIVAGSPAISHRNLNPAGALAAAGLSPILPVRLACGAAGVGLVLLTRGEADRPERRIAGLVLGSFLCSPYVMPYDAAVVAPAAVMMLRRPFWPAGLLLLIPAYVPWAGSILVTFVAVALLWRQALTLRLSRKAVLSA
jgi:hypothetical protein